MSEFKTQFFDIEEWDSKHPKAKPYPRTWAQERWFPLAKMLDVVRTEAGAVIRVTPNGGYRCPEHNAAVGGKVHSQHQMGTAADIVCHGWTAKALHALITKLYRAGHLPELGGLGIYPGFVHVDTRKRPGDRLTEWTGSRTDADNTV